MTFKRAIVSTVVQLEFDCEDVEAAASFQKWKRDVDQACNFNASLTSPQLPTKPGSESNPNGAASSSPTPVRLDMPYHITLAYRIDMNSRNSSEDEKLAEALTAFVKNDSGATQDTSKSRFSSLKGQLLLNPPILSCYPDMTIFPTSPLYTINQPLLHLLKRNYGYLNLCVPQVEHPFKDMTEDGKCPFRFTAPLMPTARMTILGDSVQPKDDESLPTCAIVALGRALEDGKVTETLERRLELAMETYRSEVEKSAKTTEIAGLQSCPRPILIVSGGFTSREAPNLSEAHAMRDWLVSRYNSDPICKEALRTIVIEEDSLTTVENAIYVRRKLLGEEPILRRVTRLIVATTDSHGPRSQYIFKTVMQPEERLEGAQSSKPEEVPKTAQASISAPICADWSVITVELVTCPDADPNDAKIETWKTGKAWHELLTSSLAVSPAFVHSSSPRLCYQEVFQSVNSDSTSPYSFLDQARIILTQHSLLHLVHRNRVKELRTVLRALYTLSKDDVRALVVRFRSFAFQILPGNLNFDSIFFSKDLHLPYLGPILASIAIEKTRPQILEALLEFIPNLATFKPQPDDNLLSTLDALMIGYRVRTGGKAVAVGMLSSSLRFLTERIPYDGEILPLEVISSVVEAMGLNWTSQWEQALFFAGIGPKPLCLSPFYQPFTSKRLGPGRLWNPSYWLGAILFELFFLPSLLLRLSYQEGNTKASVAHHTPSSANAGEERRQAEDRARSKAIEPVLRSVLPEPGKSTSTLPLVFLVSIGGVDGGLRALRQLEADFKDAIPGLSDPVLSNYHRRIHILIEGEEDQEKASEGQKRFQQLFASIASHATQSLHPESSNGSSSVTGPKVHYYPTVRLIATTLREIRKGTSKEHAPDRTRNLSLQHANPAVFVLLTSPTALESPELKEELKKKEDGRRYFQCFLPS